MAGAVRLTVQLRGHDNKVRANLHVDVPVSKVAEAAHELAGDLATFYKAQARKRASDED